MENVIGGALKLKKPIGGISKKKKKSSTKVAASGKEPADSGEMEEAGAASTSSRDIPDPRTAYEKKWDEQVKKLDAKRAKEQAKKTHRDRIEEFNHQLSLLSEHNDLPRVSGGA